MGSNISLTYTRVYDIIFGITLIGQRRSQLFACEMRLHSSKGNNLSNPFCIFAEPVQRHYLYAMWTRDSSPVVDYGGIGTESDSDGTPQVSGYASGGRSSGRDKSAVVTPTALASTVTVLVNDNENMTDVVTCDII